MMEGLVTTLRALRASGARRLLSPHSRFLAFDAPLLPGHPAHADSRSDASPAVSTADPAFEAWLAEVRRAGAHPMRVQMASAHQMGSARMGADAATSVADVRGEAWTCAGLHIADASAFPTATGVNPMVTVEALAFLTCERLAERLTGAPFEGYPIASAPLDDW